MSEQGFGPWSHPPQLKGVKISVSKKQKSTCCKISRLQICLEDYNIFNNEKGLTVLQYCSYFMLIHSTMINSNNNLKIWKCDKIEYFWFEKKDFIFFQRNFKCHCSAMRRSSVTNLAGTVLSPLQWPQLCPLHTWGTLLYFLVHRELPFSHTEACALVLAL